MKFINVYLLIFLTFGIFSNATAGPFFRTSFNYINTLGNDVTGTNADVKSASEFEVSKMEIGWRGDLKYDMSYYARFDVKNMTTSDAEYGAIDYAFLTKKVNDKLKINMGKIFDLGPFQTSDEYSYTGIRYFTEGTGFGFDYTIGDHLVQLSILHGPEYTDTRSPYYQIAYSASFMDGKIKPVLAYQQKKNTYQANDTIMQFGLGLDFKPLFVGIDYHLEKLENFNHNPTGTSASKDIENTYLGTFVKYDIKTYKLFAKYYTYEEEKFNTSAVKQNSWETTGMEIGVEFVPVADEDLNFHLVYNQEVQDKGAFARDYSASAPIDTGDEIDDEKKTAKIMAGIRYRFSTK